MGASEYGVQQPVFVTDVWAKPFRIAQYRGKHLSHDVRKQYSRCSQRGMGTTGRTGVGRKEVCINEVKRKMTHKSTIFGFWQILHPHKVDFVAVKCHLEPMLQHFDISVLFYMERAFAG